MAGEYTGKYLSSNPTIVGDIFDDVKQIAFGKVDLLDELRVAKETYRKSLFLKGDKASDTQEEALACAQEVFRKLRLGIKPGSSTDEWLLEREVYLFENIRFTF